MFRCVTTLSRFRGPQASRIRGMLKRVATRCELRDIHRFEFRAAVRYLERRAGRKVVAA
jgi:hypothetical protein